MHIHHCLFFSKDLVGLFKFLQGDPLLLARLKAFMNMIELGMEDILRLDMFVR